MEASRGYGRDALHMLDLLSEKDLRDTPSGVLMDHISHFAYNGDDPVLRDYVLNPRVGLELLSPYRLPDFRALLSLLMLPCLPGQIMCA